jgi:hypothetical protein
MGTSLGVRDPASGDLGTVLSGQEERLQEGA